MHFPLWVLLRPPDPELYPTDDDLEDFIRSEVQDLMSPFNHEIPVPAYCRPCLCVGRAAREGAAFDARQIADEMTMVPEDKRNEADREYWNAAFDRACRQLFDQHPDKDKPDPDCEECDGKGRFRTTSNPNGQWDHYEIGGRWCYSLIDPDLYDDKETSLKVFDLADSRELVFGSENRHVSQAGLKNEELERIPGNVLRARDVLKHLPVLPDAILTPLGEWHALLDWEAIDRYGWHMRNLNKPRGLWEEEVKEVLEENLDCLLVVIDCHT